MIFTIGLRLRALTDAKIAWKTHFPSGHEQKIPFFSRSNINSKLCSFSSYSPHEKVSIVSRLSALQFDATRLVCAFTHGFTQNHHHVRQGCIRQWKISEC